MIRLMLAEDQTLVRAALAALLRLEGDIEVVAEATRGDEIVPRALASRPDVALVDIELPGGDGLTAAAALRAALPACRVIILTTFGRPGYLRRALEGQALGFMVKDAPPDQLVAAIRRVMAGDRVVDPVLAAAALAEPNPFSPREREVLRLVGAGRSTGEIADTLSLSEGTVRNYLSIAMQEVGARSSYEAAQRAERQGWL